jgi:hypothetical protein
MQAKRRSYHAPAADSFVADDGPARYWGIAVIAACTASWAAIFAAAKLIFSYI